MDIFKNLTIDRQPLPPFSLQIFHTITWCILLVLGFLILWKFRAALQSPLGRQNQSSETSINILLNFGILSRLVFLVCSTINGVLVAYIYPIKDIFGEDFCWLLNGAIFVIRGGLQVCNKYNLIWKLTIERYYAQN